MEIHVSILRAICLTFLVLGVSRGAHADRATDLAFAEELSQYLNCQSFVETSRTCQLLYRGLVLNTDRQDDEWKVGIVSVPIGFLVTVIESRCVTVHDVRISPPRFADLSVATGRFYASRKECIEDKALPES